MAAAFIRCDGCGYFRPAAEMTLGVLHVHTFRYCPACELARLHHPDEVILAGRPA